MNQPDQLTLAMQNEVLKIAKERLGYTLPQNLTAKVRENRWGFIGLETMIDVVRSIEVDNIEKYLSTL